MRYTRKHRIIAAQCRVQYIAGISISEKASVRKVTLEDGEIGYTITAEVTIPERDMEMWLAGEDLS